MVSVRDRSRSPTSKKKSSGLRWKQKSKTTSDADGDTNGRSEREDVRDRYRERSPPRRRSPVASNRDINEDRESARGDRGRISNHKPALDVADQDTKTPTPVDTTSVASKFGARAKTYKPAPAPDSTTLNTSTVLQHQSQITQGQPISSLPPSNEEMIIVYINDRLGTKAAIPCMASDPVKAFKYMVASRIGRPVHEILIKRQGERPFKDVLTLRDYGVGNGVQLDLELDTGD